MKNETIYKRMRIDKHPGLHDIGCHGACCLRATDLGLQLGETTVFEHVDLHIHCGQIVALIGPNGAGKSSLLKAILGQVPHTGKLNSFWPPATKPSPPSAMCRRTRSLTAVILSACWICLSPASPNGLYFYPYPKHCGKSDPVPRARSCRKADRPAAGRPVRRGIAAGAAGSGSGAGTPYSDFGRADVRRGYRWHETAAGYAR